MWELEFLRAMARALKTIYSLIGVYPPAAE
jgi:hypothetical protein